MNKTPKILKTHRSLKKLFKRYGYDLNPNDPICGDSVMYDTHFYIGKNNLVKQIRVKIFNYDVFTIMGNKIKIQIEFYSNSNPCTDLCFIINNDVYGTVLKFFKDNNVLTKDEMTIKDIIE